jgi:hypothetical protein
VTSDEDDDDALTWAGGSDPTYTETPEPVRPMRAKRTTLRHALGAGASVPEPAEGPIAAAALPPVTSAAVLLSLGVLAGVYLLYTIGWVVSFERMLNPATTPFDQGAFRVQQIFGIAAPALWFSATIWLTRGRAPLARLLWLVGGALVLVPWSFTFGS